MSEALARRNGTLLVWVRAAAFGIATGLALAGFHVQPTAVPVLVGLLVAGLCFISSKVATAAAVIALAVPIFAGNAVVGIVVLIAGLAAVNYLGGDGGTVFLLCALALVGAYVGPVWAAAALAGYLLARGEGALAAVLACLTIEAVGIMVGKPQIGLVVTGASPTGLLAEGARASFSSVDWIVASFSNIRPEALSAAFAPLRSLTQPIALVVQPLIWAAGALVASFGHHRRAQRGSVPLVLGWVTAGVFVVAAGTVVLRTVLKLPVDWGTVGTALAFSLVVAVGIAAANEYLFSEPAAEPEPVAPAAAPASGPTSQLAAEDADIDELLTLIATAEETVANELTTEGIVMITDMKSFSRMTEEDGSVDTAKAIQRHRDLLLPVISAHAGKGKSTGGDGLVAVFDSAAESLRAAVEMQRVLSEYNRTHPRDRDLLVRVGLAQGEVVCDRGGRPFIGSALNVAARVMALADGGRIFTTLRVADAADEAGVVGTASLGSFELKNICESVEIVEVLWYDGQQPDDPRSRM